nr:DUF58 domain-containing protein [Phaeovibrio sulfidiphilus]
MNRAEREAERLPPLLVAAERIAASVTLGFHGRRMAGPGEDFWQFRPYQAGDPTRRIDWRRSARADQIYLREQERDSAQSLWFGCDQSASMDYRSARTLPHKRTRALELCLALASMAVRAGERIAIAGRDSRAAHGRGALVGMARVLGSDPPPSLEKALGAPVPAHSLVVFFGDFLDPLDQVRSAIRRLADAGVKGHLVQVLDPAELALPFSGRIRFEGPEGEAPVLIDHVEALRDRYLHRIEAHLDALDTIVRRHGWGCHRHCTDQPAQLALRDLYLALGTGPARASGG